MARIRNEKSAQRPKFSAGRPCGHPAKNFGQALQILEKQAFWHGHAARTSTEKPRSEKLRAEFSYPIETQETPQNGKNVHGFQVRTPIYHTVRVSRVFGGPPQSLYPTINVPQTQWDIYIYNRRISWH